MRNILLILKHEYITRVSKKSFIIMTLLGPLLIGLFYGSIVWLSVSQISKSTVRKVMIIDPSNALQGKIKDSKDFHFRFGENKEEGKQEVEAGNFDMFLNIQPENADSIDLYCENSLSISEKESLKGLISDEYFTRSLAEKGLNKEMIDSLNHHIVIKDQLMSGKNGATEIRSVAGYIGSIVIYMFIFLYGVMIMRGVTEEKNNRIVEIIISAVRPFQLMMGKILGVALVGLTQFFAWVILSGIVVSVVSLALGIEMAGNMPQELAQTQMNQVNTEMLAGIQDQINSLNFPKIIVGFMLFFVGGFLLYSSIFAAIGSAVDSDTETQQFMLPVSMPLVFGILIAQLAILKDPNSSLAVWSSMIPFTSPVVMMVRLTFDVSWTEIFISVIILYASFVLVVWLAARIYRIGILSYGKKASYKQMFKWLMMKE